MDLLELIWVSIGLAMDAFSVSIGKGLGIKSFNVFKGFVISLIFGLFQALMPLFGYFLLDLVKNYSIVQTFIVDNSRYIAFILLAFLGLKMIFDAIKSNSNKNGPIMSVNKNSTFTKSLWIELLVLGIATSLDAFMVGVAFSAIQVNIYFAVIIIGLVTFILCLIGVYIGHFFGSRWEKPATICGGIILILLALKFLFT